MNKLIRQVRYNSDNNLMTALVTFLCSFSSFNYWWLRLFRHSSNNFNLFSRLLDHILFSFVFTNLNFIYLTCNSLINRIDKVACFAINLNFIYSLVMQNLNNPYLFHLIILPFSHYNWMLFLASFSFYTCRNTCAVIFCIPFAANKWMNE